MATHTDHSKNYGIYFITFTCCKWRPLFEEVNLYSYFNKWFEYLKKMQADLVGYIIMPNHFHALIHVSEICDASLNKLVSNGKRFLAYEIISRLKQKGNTKELFLLANEVSSSERLKGKQHEVFKLSFDAKFCYSREMIEKKLDYIHQNPVSGKWELVNNWVDYPYSSAKFYELGTSHPYLVHYMDLI